MTSGRNLLLNHFVALIIDLQVDINVILSVCHLSLKQMSHWVCTEVMFIVIFDLDEVVCGL